MPLFRIRTFSTLLILAVITGCATVDAERASDDILTDSTQYYVEKLDADERGIERVIADELNALGLDAAYGTDVSATDDIDVLVTYQDRWNWDVTMYMRRLDIQFREPGTRQLLTEGTATRSSLTRAEPAVIARELLEEMTGR